MATSIIPTPIKRVGWARGNGLEEIMDRFLFL